MCIIFILVNLQTSFSSLPPEVLAAFAGYYLHAVFTVKLCHLNIHSFSTSPLLSDDLLALAML